jgi:anti-sigma regulatory factor (Ser/Thr protein kinase)
MYQLIDQVIDVDSQPKAESFIFDFNGLSFIEPVGYTVLSNLFEWLVKRGISVKIRRPENINRDAIRFLDDSLFFERYIGKKYNQFASPRSTTIPLKQVSYQTYHQWLENDFLTWLSRNLSLSIASLANIKVCFQEIFNNINDHAHENIGCVFAQHYPQKNSVCVAISDFGVGIPYNIQKYYPSLTDGEALKRATVPGVTTKSNPQNRGAGLDTLISNVVKNNHGHVYIHSNHGILICNYQDNDVLMTPRESDSLYPGTLLEIVFKTDTIENVVEEEFEW